MGLPLPVLIRYVGLSWLWLAGGHFRLSKSRQMSGQKQSAVIIRSEGIFIMRLTLCSHTRASSVATAGPGFRTAELRVTSSAQGGRTVWLAVRVAVIRTQCKPWRSISISPTRGHARRLCRRGRAVHNLILWGLAGRAAIPRLRREGADARLVVT